MIGSGAQIKAARGFLGWSQADLARESGLSINAIRYWEADQGWQISLRSARSYGPARIELAFNRHGLKLIYYPQGIQADKRYKHRAKLSTGT